MFDALSSGDLLGTGLWLVFFASAALAVSLGLILAYHWFVHAHNTAIAFIAVCAYAGISFALLSMMFTALALLA